MNLQYNTLPFPVPSGTFARDILLCMNVLIAFFCFEFFFFFFQRYRNQRVKTQYYQEEKNRSGLDRKKLREYSVFLKNRELGWGILYFFLGYMMVMFVIGDFFINDLQIRSAFRYAGYLDFAIAMTIFCYFLEQNELHKNHHRFTQILIVSLAGLILCLLFFSDYAIYIIYFIIPITLGLSIQYAVLMIKQIRGMRKFNFPYYSFSVGMIMFLSGFLSSTDLFLQTFGWGSRILGDFLQFLGVVACALSFYNLPSLHEMAWFDKIQKLYVIYPSGICVFEYSFHQQKIKEGDILSDLTTSAIMAIKDIIQDVSSKGKDIVESIRKDQFILLLAQGSHIISVIISTEDSLVLREKNHLFCTQFESTYQHILQNWSGNVSAFKKTDEIVKQVFLTQ